MADMDRPNLERENVPVARKHETQATLKTIDIISTVLLIIGGLNWGLIGFFDFNLVAAIFGEMSIVSRIIYVLVGLSALYEIVMFNAMRRRWAYDYREYREVHRTV